MQYTVLAADDETELLDALELYAERENIKLLKADNGITALELFRAEKPHLVLLDIMMPGLDGFAVLRKIREESKVPAIMLTARGEDYDKILGLELGADDYITKPYNPLVVMARVKAQLRRSYDYHEEAHAAEKLTCADVELDPAESTVTKGGEPVMLTKTEYLILEYLLKNKGRILTKQQIFTYVWGGEFISDDSTVMVHISNLRAKIEDDPKSPKLIKTVKGLGYKAEKL
ncbi:MAG: response regulator transcription factor [Ruminococcus sp.]|nr:response regulator transcription factor [Ruminococcus sp.]